MLLVGIGGLEQRLDLGGHTGVGPHDGEAAVGVDRRIHSVLVALEGGDIGLDGDGSATVFLHEPHGLLGGFKVEVRDHNGCALLGETDGAGTAHAGSATGDDRDFVLQTHNCSFQR